MGGFVSRLFRKRKNRSGSSVLEVQDEESPSSALTTATDVSARAISLCLVRLARRKIVENSLEQRMTQEMHGLIEGRWKKTESFSRVYSKKKKGNMHSMIIIVFLVFTFMDM